MAGKTDTKTPVTPEAPASPIDSLSKGEKGKLTKLFAPFRATLSETAETVVALFHEGERIKLQQGMHRITMGTASRLATIALQGFETAVIQAVILEAVGLDPETGEPYGWKDVERWQAGSVLAETVPATSDDGSLAIRSRFSLAAINALRGVTEGDDRNKVAEALAREASSRDKGDDIALVGVREARQARDEWKAENGKTASPKGESDHAAAIRKTFENDESFALLMAEFDSLELSRDLFASALLMGVRIGQNGAKTTNRYRIAVAELTEASGDVDSPEAA